MLITYACPLCPSNYLFKTAATKCVLEIAGARNARLSEYPKPDSVASSVNGRVPDVWLIRSWSDCARVGPVEPDQTEPSRPPCHLTKTTLFFDFAHLETGHRRDALKLLSTTAQSDPDAAPRHSEQNRYCKSFLRGRLRTATGGVVCIAVVVYCRTLRWVSVCWCYKE